MYFLVGFKDLNRLFASFGSNYFKNYLWLSRLYQDGALNEIRFTYIVTIYVCDDVTAYHAFILVDGTACNL